VGIVFAVREPSGAGELVGLPELRLTGLLNEDARALLASVIPGRLDVAVRERIVAETRGNPLALVELTRGLGPAQLAGGFALPHTGDLPRHIEHHYVGRLRALPDATQRLMLLAAADPVGNATRLWEAARTLGIDPDDAEPALREELLEVEPWVRFRHPLVRSAVYRGSSPAERRAAHRALESATDPATDPDRRAWHRAHAASEPDEEVADELIRSASRAQARGGAAAAAAFLERAVSLTPDASQRATRALGAARAKFAAGDLAGAELMLATADSGQLDELGRAQVLHVRAQIAFDLRRGSDAPPLLLRAAQKLETLDGALAREAYLEALVAAIYVGRLADDDAIAEIARAARAVAVGPEPSASHELLRVGLATRLIDGYVAAAPVLRRALSAYRSENQQLDWRWVSYTLTAMDLWDDEAWLELASSQTEFARATGTLTLLPYALDYLAEHHIQAGQLSDAAGLLTEAESLAPGIRAENLPYIPLLLACWRGEESTAAGLSDTMTRDALARAEGAAITVVEYATAVLHNGLGQYDLAAAAAQTAADSDDMVISSWALCELAEATSRIGQVEVARGAAELLSERALASDTPWARGMDARTRALVAPGEQTEQFHHEAIEWLGRCRMRVHLARTHLSYGEWLRREGRRVDAREQLRTAYELLVAMGLDAFAERARRELLATGETVRKRTAETRDELTAQERQVAQLARDGLTNPEIGARLFISPRTVQYHLRKVFNKLDITSRHDLHRVLPEASATRG
jgi:DNA-binding CsgD family transcriptional regulator